LPEDGCRLRPPVLVHGQKLNLVLTGLEQAAQGITHHHDEHEGLQKDQGHRTRVFEENLEIFPG